MPRPAQEKLLGLCLVLLAAGLAACREDDPAPAPAQKQELPFWALCENWRRRDGSCDQNALLADYQGCLRSEGDPTRERLLDHRVRSTAVSRAWQRATIVCLEKRAWMMTEAGRRNLPGRPPPPPPS
jgi:hypothetical protein